MARFLVVRPSTAERVPFLRGILVQSLVSAGLSFQDAYEVAQAIRDDLADGQEISTHELRLRVAEELEQRFGPTVRQAYEHGSSQEQQILVRKGGRLALFSVGLMTRSLEACAIDRTEAFRAAQRVQQTLKDGNDGVVDHLELRRVIYHSLREHGATAAAESYLSWRLFKDSGTPLVLLIGGAPGTGKSTIASELAYRLSVVRTQSTDMMRELIRCYLGPEAAPTLAYSSFEAWRGLAKTKPDMGAAASHSRVIAGFLAQSRAIKTGLEATIQRAVKERQDLIVDGVQVLTPELDLADIQSTALAVPLMLVVATREELASRFAARGEEQPGRGASRYLRHMDAIWELQSFLLGLADGIDIPLIINRTPEDTVLQIIAQVSQKVAARCPPDAAMLA